MKIIKLIVAVIAVILAGMFVFFAIGVLANIVWLLALLGALYLVGAIAVRLFRRKESPPEIEVKDAERELASAQRLLEDYKRKVAAEK